MRPALVAVLLAAVSLPMPLFAQTNSGAYLAGRHAGADGDFAAAATYFSRALNQDPRNPSLMEAAISSHLSLGDVDRAAPLARRLIQTGGKSQIANMALLADASAREAWDGIIEDIEAGQTVGPLFDGLMESWAQVGAGDMTEALASFDEVSEVSGVKAFGLFHKALALALVGDLESADTILAGEEDDPLPLTRRGVLAHAQILSQLERNDEAVALIDERIGEALDPGLTELRARLEAGETVPFDVVTSVRDGVAEIFYTIGLALSGEAADSYTLLYTSTAEHLRPDHVEAILATAGLLENLGQHEAAVEVYGRVPRDHPQFHAAELGRADALTRAGDSDAAIEVMQNLVEEKGDLPIVHIALGDALRQLERYREAADAYDRAIALVDEPSEAQWVVYFARGIARERTDRWEEAEADFLKALELRPDQPQVLNYLGYSYLEKGGDLDEALDYIERAVAAQPNSGYIVDSLGWAYYRLGDYAQAVDQLERATELMPTDPVVNDHLGDALWAVGRGREAQFQWRRALSFEPEEADADRIRRKLEVGLDRVLSEEGAEPLQVAKGG
ncbi:tetratricopeptide repeat protein [Rhodobacteraceae bacterium MCCB 386]|nr:tetratricopeptide repeat protein [Roseitranquillus sediminis]